MSDEQPIEPFEFLLTGGIESPKDYRDVDLASVTPAFPQTLPDSFFVDISMLPVWMQNKLGACVGHAAGKYEQLEKFKTIKTIIPLSPRFLYAVAKCQDGLQEQGTYPRMVAQIMQKTGCATEATVPNDTTLDHETYVYQRQLANFPKAAFDEAAQHKITSYAFPGTTAAGLQNAILNSNGCMLLLRLGKEWWTATNGQISWAAADILPLRPPAVVVSGHEVYLYGYDHVDGRLRLWIFNSWSKAWGQNGVGYFFFDEMERYLNESVTAVDLPDTLLNHLKELPAPGVFKHNFQVSIHFGDKGDEVKALQTALYNDGELKVNPAIFGNFGPLTQAALKAFQYKYNIATPAEIEAVDGKSCGPRTRAVLNNLFNK